ncbi:MAG TPA: hypothetical protein VI789_07930 [Dehalococcoidia bacterium]|nr:hypothetical protein [Dehalococcoidia bacterium]
MGLLDVLFGRSRGPKSKTEPLFAISTAAVTLQTQFNLRPTGQAAVVFRPVESASFEETRQELDDLLRVAARSAGSRIDLKADEFGYVWVVVEDPQFEDLVTALHMAALTLTDGGFRDRLLAAAFPFEGREGRVYWLYSYKLGRFYPFAPEDARSRNNALELRLSAAMARELPMEKDTTLWYGLYGAPI